MPMRAIRASKAYATAHVGENLWLWTAIFAIATAITAALLWGASKGSRWGDLAALFGCITGVLVMVQSQSGFAGNYPPTDEDENASPVADQAANPTWQRP
jgi:hypothetical protein